MPTLSPTEYSTVYGRASWLSGGSELLQEVGMKWNSTSSTQPPGLRTLWDVNS
jgi:hypothetical protein